MFKKSVLIIALQAVVISMFIMIAAGSSESDAAVDNANRIYRGARPLVNN